MKRTNMTDKNLQTVLKHLDDACGSLDNAIIELSSMTALPQNMQDYLNRIGIDFDDIVSLKNDIESLQEQRILNKHKG